MFYANCHFYCSDLEWLGPFENRTKIATPVQKENEMAAIAIQNLNVKMFSNRMPFIFRVGFSSPYCNTQIF